MGVLFTVCSQAGLTEIVTSFHSACYNIPVYVGFEIPENYLLVIGQLSQIWDPTHFRNGWSAMACVGRP